MKRQMEVRIQQWQYDTDYEFLNDGSIKQIIIAGARYLDGYV